MVAWLEDWLRRYKGGLVMVTHDRYFLERVVNHITELSRGKLYHYEANYSRYLELREQRAQMAEASERKRQSILRVEREWILRGCQARSTKSKERIQRYEELKDQKAPERDSTVQLSAASSRLGKKIITLEHISKGYDGRTIFRDFSYGLLRSDRIGIVGQNGAGKTTTMRMLCGIMPPSSGDVCMDGKSILRNLVDAKRQIGYLPENAPLHGNMTVRSFLVYCGRMRGLSGGALRAAVDVSIGKCALESVEGEEIESLSKGFRRRVCLAQAIMHEPRVLVMDEPTDGLDPNQKREIRALIRAMREHSAIIVSTHILEEVDAVCDRVLTISEGRKVFDDTVSEFRALSPYGRLDDVFAMLSDGGTRP